MGWDFWNEPDWVSTNETDGEKFYGYDDGEGRTAWYDSDGNLDALTDTPSDNDTNDYLSRY